MTSQGNALKKLKLQKFDFFPLKCLHKTHFKTQCWGQKRPHASSEMDKLTSNTNEEDQIMASVARDLGEDLTAEPLVEFSSWN